ncbi:RNA binding, variant 2 [Bonamia ostreae]
MTQINSMKNEDINLEASIFIEPQSENLSENIVEISNMPENMSFNDVIRLFSTYGEIRGMNINNDNPSFRIGYVNYKNPESAKSAVSELKDFKTEDMTTPLQIRFARKKNFSPSTKTNFTNLNSRNILLTNIPMEWDEPMLSKLLSDCGTVIWAKMDLNLKLRKKAATATFEDPETARNAVQRLNGLSVDNKDRKLSARIVSETRAQDGRTVETGDSCKYFDRGYCYRGSNCWFAHENRENFDGKSAPRYRTRYLGGGVTEEVSSKGHAFFTTKNKK